MGKGQIEIVGLLIIVLMVSFMLLFATRTILTPPLDKSDERENLASNLLIGMLETSSDCVGSMKISDLIEDSAKYQYYGSGMIQCTNGKKSLQYVRDSLKIMLERTLGAWNMPYELRATLPGSNAPFIHIVEGDDEGKAGSSAIVPLPIGNRQSVSVELCIGRCIDIDI